MVISRVESVLKVIRTEREGLPASISALGRERSDEMPAVSADQEGHKHET